MILASIVSLSLRVLSALVISTDLWHPENWFDTDARGRLALQTAAANAFGLEGTNELVEVCLKLFFVPYWMVRVALYSPIDHATAKRQYTEVRCLSNLVAFQSNRNLQGRIALHLTL
jgi:hypothetical protein